MKRKSKRIYESLITIQGEIINSNCPECDGEGVDFVDNTHARGGEIIPQLCSLCEGDGVITEEIVEDIKYDHDGNQHIIFKQGDEPYDSNRK